MKLSYIKLNLCKSYVRKSFKGSCILWFRWSVFSSVPSTRTGSVVFVGTGGQEVTLVGDRRWHCSLLGHCGTEMSRKSWFFCLVLYSCPLWIVRGQDESWSVERKFGCGIVGSLLLPTPQYCCSFRSYNLCINTPDLPKQLHVCLYFLFNCFVLNKAGSQ